MFKGRFPIRFYYIILRLREGAYPIRLYHILFYSSILLKGRCLFYSTQLYSCVTILFCVKGRGAYSIPLCYTFKGRGVTIPLYSIKGVPTFKTEVAALLYYMFKGRPPYPILLYHTPFKGGPPILFSSIIFYYVLIYSIIISSILAYCLKGGCLFYSTLSYSCVAILFCVKGRGAYSIPLYYTCKGRGVTIPLYSIKGVPTFKTEVAALLYYMFKGRAPLSYFIISYFV